jgi:hypothetical protein
MAKQKKKKKTDTTCTDNLDVVEYEGWKIGQKVWCRRYPSNDLACGPIKAITAEGPEPHFTFIDKFDGSFRLALFTSIIPVPSHSMQQKLDTVLARQARQIKTIEEKRALKAASRR